MGKRHSVRTVQRGEARKSLAKAKEFLQAARDGRVASRWTAAGLAAIHAGIAAGDAALIAAAGVRSASQDHSAILDILGNEVDAFRGAHRRQLTGLLKMKNTVAYEGRLLTDVESRQLLDFAERLVAWAGMVVEKHVD